MITEQSLTETLEPGKGTDKAKKPWALSSFPPVCHQARCISRPKRIKSAAVMVPLRDYLCLNVRSFLKRKHTHIHTPENRQIWVRSCLLPQKMGLHGASATFPLERRQHDLSLQEAICCRCLYGKSKPNWFSKLTQNQNNLSSILCHLKRGSKTGTKMLGVSLLFIVVYQPPP